MKNRIIPGEQVSHLLPASPRPVVYKSRSASPTPKSILRHDSHDRSVANEDLNAARGKLNPVKELQMIGRQNSNNHDEAKLFL